MLYYDTLPADVGSYVKIQNAFEVLHLIETQGKEQAKKKVLQDNIFDYNTSFSRRRLFSTINRAFLNFKTRWEEEVFLRLLNLKINDEAKKQILLYTLSRNSYTTYRLTLDVLFPSYIRGESLLRKSEILNYLKDKSKITKTVGEWTKETRETVGRKYLTMMKKFGYLTGRQKKKIIYFAPELESFVYLTMSLINQNKSPKEILKSDKYKQLLLQKRDVEEYMKRAAKAGYLDYARVGDVVELTPKYKFQELPNAVQEKHGNEI